MTDLDLELERLRARYARQDRLAHWALALAFAAGCVTVALTLDLLWRMP